MNPQLTARWAPPISILGVPFDSVTTKQTLSLFRDMIASRQPHYVATANVDFVVQARHDLELRRILNDAHLVLCDGMPLVWASRLLGNALPERVAGSDLVPLLLSQAQECGHRVFFLGGQEDVAATALANIRARHPKLQIAGVMSPPFSPLLEMDHEGISQAIRAAKPDILLVSFGCPKQEKWISMNYRSLGVPVCMGVGATIDFLAGAVKRAPQWMQRVGMEWLFRLLQEPKRLFARYFTDLLGFASGIIHQLTHLSRSAAAGSREMSAEVNSGVQFVDLPERFDVASVLDAQDAWTNVGSGARSAIVLGSRVQSADSTALAMLSRTAMSLRSHGQHLVIAEPSDALLRALEVMRTDSILEVCASRVQALRMIEDRSCEETVALTSVASDVINWQGEVTAGNADEIWNRTHAVMVQVQAADRHSLTIDLGAVRFVDSTGVGLMVRAKKQCGERGIDICFQHPSRAATSVIRALRMEAYLLGHSPALSA